MLCWKKVKNNLALITNITRKMSITPAVITCDPTTGKQNGLASLGVYMQYWLSNKLGYWRYHRH